MTNEEKAERMKAWFKDLELPERIDYGTYYKIQTPARYVDTAMQTMQYSDLTSNAFRAAYYRLYRLKKHLEETNL